MTTRQVVIIGGGVIGVSCAYYLQKSGWQVTVVEKDKVGSACSHGNCGYLSPSHVMPIAEPGLIGKALKSMIKPDSPFYIKPRLDIALWYWLLNFARRCNEHDRLDAARGIHRLLQSSTLLYEDLLTNENLECEWHKAGLAFVYQNAEPFEDFAATNQLLKDQFDMPAVRYDSKEIRELEPALKPGVAGGWYYPQDAHLRPDKLVASWRQLVESRGGRFIENSSFEGFVVRNQRAVAIQSTHGEITGDAFVAATGAFTPMISRHLGCSIPIQPGKGYSLTMPRPTICPKIPMIFSEHKVAITPMDSCYRVGSTMEFAGYDTTLNARRLEFLSRGASVYLQEPTSEPILEKWYGWRPMTWDSLPIIDRAPVAGNVFIAAGHSMLGLSMSTGTGKLVSEMVSDHTLHLDPKPYRVDRF